MSAPYQDGGAMLCDGRNHLVYATSWHQDLQMYLCCACEALTDKLVVRGSNELEPERVKAHTDVYRDSSPAPFTLMPRVQDAASIPWAAIASPDSERRAAPTLADFPAGRPEVTAPLCERSDQPAASRDRRSEPCYPER